jgi:hypothetical protein
MIARWTPEEGSRRSSVRPSVTDLEDVRARRDAETAPAFAPDRSIPQARQSHAPLLQLQRTAGNRAVATMVARQPHVKNPPPPPVPLDQADDKLIPPADRNAMVTATTGFIPLAFTAFANATIAHAAAIKNEAKAKAEMYAMVIDVATGFLAPVFANWVVGKMAAKVAETQVEEVTKKAVVKLITKQDTFKAAFTGATKVGNQLMKKEANSLFGETEIDGFALALRNTFQHGAGVVLNGLTRLTDEQLMATWIAYDPQNADESAYRGVLSDLFAHYQKQVEPIGDDQTFDMGTSAAQSVYDVQLSSRTRLANVVRWSSGENNLWAWVTPDMEPIARAKAKALGLGVPTIALADLQLSLAEIIEPARPELRGENMEDIARALTSGERQTAAANPDVTTVVLNAREHNGRVPGQYERHKTLFVLRGLSSHALDILDELDSWGTSDFKINKYLDQTDAAERRVLAQDQWFVGRLRANMGKEGLQKALYTLGLGPPPPPPAPEPDFDPYEHIGMP